MNILLTCAGRRNYIVDYFREALAGTGGKVYAANSTGDSTALIAAERGFIVPALKDPGYIDAMIRLCHNYDIRAIIPLFDLELPLLARASQRFADAGIFVLVSSMNVIEICNDKWRTQEFLRANGIQTPPTFLNPDEAQAAVDNGDISFPLMIKPRWGMGSIALQEAENEMDLCFLYDKVKRIIRKTYLATESRQDPERDVLIQQKVSGEEYGLDVVNDLSGNYVTTFVKKKIAMRSGETDSATTVDHAELRQLGQHIAEVLHHVANLDMDVFVNETGLYVLELNARFGGGYPFSHIAGANVPAAIIAWLQGTSCDPAWFKISYGVTAYKGISIMRSRDFDHIDSLLKEYSDT